MDTLGVKLIESGPIYTNLSFYTALLALFALVISGFTFKKQYGAGVLKIPPIKSFGMVGTSTPGNPPTGLMFVVPILFYVTGYEVIGVNDIKLSIRYNGEDINFNYNHFVENLGISNVGGHQRPAAIEWAHQFTVHPKESIIKYIEFSGHMDNATFTDLMSNPSLKVHLEVKTTQKNVFRSFQSFGIKSLTSNSINSTQSYIVYENDLYS